MITVSMRSRKCLARLNDLVAAKKGEVKFCYKPSTYNDLCRKHDRKFLLDQKFNQEMGS